MRAFIARHRLIRLLVASTLALLLVVGIVLFRDWWTLSVADEDYTPTGQVYGTVPIRVRFSDEMDRASVESRFAISPEVPGGFTWTDGRTLVFTPRQPFEAGETYTVRIAAGAEALRRDTTLETPVEWQFSVRLPRVLYLGPASRFAQQLYMADPQTGEVFQLVDSEDGVIDFAVSANGSAVAYSEYNADGTANLWLLDLITQTRRPLTNCVGAVCHAPAWKPDGTQIAYQREELNSALGTGVGPARVWVLDLATLDTRLLFEDPQILGVDPTWSPDGSRIAIFDATIPGIRVHDYTGDSDVLIESLEGSVGTFSPDGGALLYPVLARGALGEAFYTHLEQVDLAALTRMHLSGDADMPVEDAAGIWSPDGTQIALLRRYLDDRYTRGRQIYLMDPETHEVTPLVVDEAYSHSVVSWDSAGQRLVYQRFPLDEVGGMPEVWMIDVTTGQQTQLGTDAFLPAWAG